MSFFLEFCVPNVFIESKQHTVKGKSKLVSISSSSEVVGGRAWPLKDDIFFIKMLPTHTHDTSIKMWKQESFVVYFMSGIKKSLMFENVILVVGGPKEDHKVSSLE